jgi:hypothetical protein
MSAALTLENLEVAYRTRGRDQRVLSGLTLALVDGEGGGDRNAHGRG